MLKILAFLLPAAVLAFPHTPDGTAVPIALHRVPQCCLSSTHKGWSISSKPVMLHSSNVQSRTTRERTVCRLHIPATVHVLGLLLVRNKVGDALKILCLLVPSIHVYKLTCHSLSTSCCPSQHGARDKKPAAQHLRLKMAHHEEIHIEAHSACIGDRTRHSTGSA